MSEPDLLTAIEPPAEALGEFLSEETARVPMPRAGVHHADAAPSSDDGKSSPASEDDFDWYADDSVIIQEQLCLAVYRNRADGVVIRQEARNWDEDDPCIVLRDHEAVRLLIAALQRELKAGR